MDANQQRGRGAPSTSGQRAIVRPFETPSSPDVYRELEQQLHDTERGRLGHRAEELSNLSDAIATEIHPLSLQVLQLARAHQLSVQLDSETIDHPLICRILEQYSNGNDLSGHSELEKRVKHNLDRFLIPHGERELAASVARVSTAFKVFSHGLDALIEDEILSEPEVSKLRSILAEIVDSQTALTTLKGEELSAAHSEQSDQVAQMFDAIQDLVELVGSDSAGFPQLVAAHIRRRETARLAELDRELLNHLTDLSQDSAPALDAALSPKARLHRMLLAHTLEEVFDSVSLLKAFSHPTLLSTSDAMYLSSDLEARFEHVGHSAAQLSKETGLEATESQRLIVTNGSHHIQRRLTTLANSKVDHELLLALVRARPRILEISDGALSTFLGELQSYLSKKSEWQDFAHLNPYRNHIAFGTADLVRKASAELNSLASGDSTAKRASDFRTCAFELAQHIPDSLINQFPEIPSTGGIFENRHELRRALGELLVYGFVSPASIVQGGNNRVRLSIIRTRIRESIDDAERAKLLSKHLLAVAIHPFRIAGLLLDAKRERENDVALQESTQASKVWVRTCLESLETLYVSHRGSVREENDNDKQGSTKHRARIEELLSQYEKTHAAARDGLKTVGRINRAVEDADRTLEQSLKQLKQAERSAGRLRRLRRRAKRRENAILVLQGKRDSWLKRRFPRVEGVVSTIIQQVKQSTSKHLQHQQKVRSIRRLEQERANDQKEIRSKLQTLLRSFQSVEEGLARLVKHGVLSTKQADILRQSIGPVEAEIANCLKVKSKILPGYKEEVGAEDPADPTIRLAIKRLGSKSTVYSDLRSAADHVRALAQVACHLTHYDLAKQSERAKSVFNEIAPLVEHSSAQINLPNTVVECPYSVADTLEALRRCIDSNQVSFDEIGEVIDSLVSGEYLDPARATKIVQELGNDR